MQGCYLYGMMSGLVGDTSNISFKTNADSIEESMSIANHKIGLERLQHY
jgi:hypothetical protein